MPDFRFCTNTVINESVSSLCTMVNKNTRVQSVLSSLTYPDLLGLSKEATAICNALLPDRFIVFAVSPKKDIFWQYKVKVFCRFRDFQDSAAARVLTIREFILLHDELLRSKELYNARTTNLPCQNGRKYQLPGQRLPADVRQQNRSQCPLCRADFEDTSTAWELLELPSPEDFLREIPQFVRKLVARSGRPLSRFPDELTSQ
ncbi:hypothetical protein FBUS_02187 [Fasciolopsis buskii]|uniref:Uncharacterized protein n=1 Tax=Fasciolopsis buskii TaxID=27845 RepID=A0A8E0S857_9TREM|nr:hypothetical protein FBUS_02187 [Fasciolopsis buski]